MYSQHALIATCKGEHLSLVSTHKQATRSIKEPKKKERRSGWTIGDLCVERFKRRVI